MATDETKRPGLEREARLRAQRDAIRLAGEDMRMVIAAAELLKLWPGDELGPEEGAQIRMIIETGMFVTYARAFTDSKLGTVNPARALTREQRELHAELLELRHKAYAHTEATPYREVIDVGDTDNWLVSSSWPLQPYLDDIIAPRKGTALGPPGRSREGRRTARRSYRLNLWSATIAGPGGYRTPSASAVPGPLRTHVASRRPSRWLKRTLRAEGLKGASPRECAYVFSRETTPRLEARLPAKRGP